MYSVMCACVRVNNRHTILARKQREIAVNRNLIFEREEGRKKKLCCDDFVRA